jgi:hypothetical protein
VPAKHVAQLFTAHEGLGEEGVIDPVKPDNEAKPVELIGIPDPEDPLEPELPMVELAPVEPDCMLIPIEGEPPVMPEGVMPAVGPTDVPVLLGIPDEGPDTPVIPTVFEPNPVPATDDGPDALAEFTSRK